MQDLNRKLKIDLVPCSQKSNVGMLWIKNITNAVILYAWTIMFIMEEHSRKIQRTKMTREQGMCASRLLNNWRRAFQLYVCDECERARASLRALEIKSSQVLCIDSAAT
jgi:hypothetical protein